ncbi:hypothetical protein [Microcoleus sp. D2_18a_D3]
MSNLLQIGVEMHAATLSCEYALGEETDIIGDLIFEIKELGITNALMV